MHEGAVSTRLGLRGWPRVAEDVIVARDLILAEATRRALPRRARLEPGRRAPAARGQVARPRASRAEVTPHHLTLTDEALLGYDTACKVNPPLREAEDVDALREALADGTIDCIATDHAPHSSLEKDCEFEAASPGMIGLEPALPLLLGLVRDGRAPPLRLVEALSTAPARVAGLDGRHARRAARAPTSR